MAEAKHRGGTVGLRWLEGRALSFGRNLSYWPFIEVLKGCFGIEGRDSEAQAWEKLEQGVRDLFGERAEEIVPYLAAVLSLELTGVYEQRVKFLDTQALRRQVFLCMHELFERLAQRQPVNVVLEDWHWVDQSSVSLCEHLAPLTSRVAFALWISTRADPAEPAQRIRVAAARHPDLRLQEVALVALAQAEGGALIDNLLGVGVLPDAIYRKILDKTGGNPFFIEEVVRALMADATLIKDARTGAWRVAKPVVDLASGHRPGCHRCAHRPPRGGRQGLAQAGLGDWPQLPPARPRYHCRSR
jgi:predicted ATPase